MRGVVTRVFIVAALAVAIPHRVTAQKPPAVRQIGRLEHVTTDSLASIGTALALRDGRVFVNDRVARRLLLLDSTLAHPTVVADTTSATAKAYGSRIANLIWFRGDSALLIDQTSLSMSVIDPQGRIARVMAIPRAKDAQAIVINSGVDADGHLVYFDALGSLPGIVMLNRGATVYNAGKPTNFAGFNTRTDSAWLIRVDLSTRTVDSITALHIPKLNREMKTDDNGGLTSIVTTPDPLPVVDEWTVTRDGVIAIVRGRDYHIDWLNRDGKWSSSPRLPFDWQRLDDTRKHALIDSTVARWQGQYDNVMRGGRGGRAAPNMAPLVAARPSLESLPAYVPPLATLQVGGQPVIADAEGNVWIRTTTIVDGRPVYDVVNRRGELFDRVQLPTFRTIAGFGPGVIYMAVKDTSGAMRLERARVR